MPGVRLSGTLNPPWKVTRHCSSKQQSVDTISSLHFHSFDQSLLLEIYRPPACSLQVFRQVCPEHLFFLLDDVQYLIFRMFSKLNVETRRSRDIRKRLLSELFCHFIPLLSNRPTYSQTSSCFHPLAQNIFLAFLSG